MRYNYTWSHIKILASICECEDTKVTITGNWISLLEEHHNTTFPFTLWPLTYRTSTVMASSSISTPKCSNIDVSVSCTMTVKIYKSNEVMVICFQHRNKCDTETKNSNSGCDQCLAESCVFENIEEAEQGENPGLLKTFRKIKSKTSKEINKVVYNSNREGSDISCMIFTGYGIGAAMASFMARDRALSQKKQQEHMEMDSPSIIVDCVTFESPSNLAGDKYWEQIESVVDKYVDVQHHDKRKLCSIKECRTLCSKLENNSSIVKRDSIILIDPIGSHKDLVLSDDDVSIESYVKEIDKKIYMLADDYNEKKNVA